MGSFYGGGGDQSGEIGTAAEERLNLHLLNNQVHVTDEEKENWNNKVSAQLDLLHQTIIFTSEN